jgi:nucleotide-binding universal stress UspA family protein
MRQDDSPPTVVVGIDGSRAAVTAALWAVDEAVSRDIPLRLVYAIDPADAKPGEEEAHRFTTAELAVRHAYMAVESLQRTLKIEVAIMQGRAVEVLRRASRSAAMVCVGALGLHHFADGHVGSTAVALAATAHCPVALIRDPGCRRTGESDWVVAEIDESTDSNAVLQLGVDQALLRGTALRVVTAGPAGRVATADEGKLAAARLDRTLDRWRHRYPGLDVAADVAHGSYLDYLTQHSRQIRLVVVGSHNRAGIAQLTQPNGVAALTDSGSSVLIGNNRRQ